MNDIQMKIFEGIRDEVTTIGGRVMADTHGPSQLVRLEIEIWCVGEVRVIFILPSGQVI